MKDMFNNPIIEGEEIYFPTSGEMDIGTVQKTSKKYVTVINCNGYSKHKSPKYCVMKNSTIYALAEIYPENFI